MSLAPQTQPEQGGTEVVLATARVPQEPRPFLRWAGGKQRLARALATFVPPQGAYSRYFEPFLGGAAVYFTVLPGNAVISDSNKELMNCYKQVSQNPATVSKLLEHYQKRDSARFYYRVRQTLKSCQNPERRAARFIYLNKTAFNGIYRVNEKGQFNVPYGPSMGGAAIPSVQILQLASQALRRAKIMSGDFESVVDQAKKGDFVYLDPPYPPRSDTAYFAHYSAERFSWNEQERVAEVSRRLAKKGCLVMVSNADQKRVISLYDTFRIRKLNAIRWLGSNGDRFGVREIVATNYNPESFSRRQQGRHDG